MKKKIALLLSALMIVGMIPATAFAVTTNTVSKIVTGSQDTKYTETTAPVLKIAEKNLTDFYNEAIQNGTTTAVTFKATLTNAEFNFSGISVGTPGSITTSTGNIDIELLAANMAMVTADVFHDGSDAQIRLPIASELTSDGEATITIDPLQTVISAGTYKFANVIDGATTTTIEKKTDLPEGGAKIKPIIITETSAGSLKGSANGEFKLKLTNGFTFENAGLSTTAGDQSTVTGLSITSYPSLGTWTVKVDADSQEMYLRPSAFATNGSKTTEAVTISITGLEVGYDDDDVKKGDIAEITLSGYDMTKKSIEVGTAVTYGVSVTAEDKTLPTFIAGRYDSDEDSLKVTMKETIKGSWLDGRKTTITFPEGVKATVESATIKDGFTGSSSLPYTLDHKADTTEITISSTGLTRNSDKAKIEFKFNISADPSFTGDVVAKFGGAGLEADMEVVVGTVAAPITVKADSNDVSIDYRNVAIGDIIVTETAAGYLKKDTVLFLGMENLDFDGTPTVEVLEGDIKIDKVKVQKVNEYDAIAIYIKTASSKTPAVLKVTDNQLYLNRSIPAGAYELSIVAGKPASESDVSKQDAIFRNYADTSKKTLDFDTDEVVVLKNFVNVVTAGRDQGDSTFTTSIAVTIGADKLIAGDKEIALDVPAYIANGYTMLPVRAITEALSSVAIVRWDDATKTVTITFGSRVISMTVDSKTMNINGVQVQMQAACEITDSRAFIPLRDLGYALGLNDNKISWDDASKTAKLN